MAPGEMQLHRTPCRPNAVATDMVNVTTAPFAAPYAVWLRSPARAWFEAVLMIEPPPASIMRGTACLHASIAPRALTAIERSQISTSRSTTVMSFECIDASVSAALLCSTCRAPHVSTAVATMACTSASIAMSVRVATDSPPAARISARDGLGPCPFRSATTTRAPSRAIVIADTRPIPDAAP